MAIVEYSIVYAEPNAFEIKTNIARLPKELKGRFTDRGQAQKALDLFELTSYSRKCAVAKQARKDRRAERAEQAEKDTQDAD